MKIFGLSTTTSWHAKCWTLNPVTTCHCRSCARVQAQKTCCLILSSFSEMVVLNWQPRHKTYGANLIAKGDLSTLSSLQVGEIHKQNDEESQVCWPSWPCWSVPAAAAHSSLMMPTMSWLVLQNQDKHANKTSTSDTKAEEKWKGS
jgi:hypothetical protein